VTVIKMVAIELDDVALTIQADDDRPPAIDPAVALVRKSGIVVGRDALMRSRLEPRRLHDRFWQDLSNDALPRPHPAGLTTADLAHAHIENAWRKAALPASEVLLVVPGDLSSSKLGLALGVARAADIPVCGLVDLGLAASVDRGIIGQALHLEIYRHRAVATILEKHDQKLCRRNVLWEGSVGMTDLFARWARWISEQFVSCTRFDPLDRADSEQELWNNLNGWLSEIRRNGGARLSFPAGKLVHEIDISEQVLAETVRQSYDVLQSLVESASLDLSTVQLVLGPRAAGLPGLLPRLIRPGMKAPIALPVAAGAAAALRYAGSIVSNGEELPLVIELDTGGSWRSPVARPPVQPAASSVGGLPSHVVHRGLAHKIGPHGLVIGREPSAEQPHLVLTGDAAGVSRSHCSLRLDGAALLVEDHSRYGTFLNERMLDGPAELAAGDHLRLGSPGIILHLIEVVSKDGPP